MRRSSSAGGRGNDSNGNYEAVNSIRRKLRDSRTKVATIIHRCELKDRNGDGLIHIDDLEDIFNDILTSEYRISRRELLKFATSITHERSNGRIEYEKLSDVLEPPRKKEVTEKWVDVDEDEGDNAWATQPGSVGAWLKGSACPSEIKNFKKFVACLESFERESGMKIHLKDDGGFSVPLGPDLRASISFSMV